MTDRRASAGDDETDAPDGTSADDASASESVPGSQGDPPSVRVIEAVAAATDTTPLELPPLGETLDPDAVDDLFEGAERGLELAFDYAGTQVTVRTGEPIQVDTQEAD